MKFCTKCIQGKDLNQFNKNKNGKDGLQVWCRSCNTSYYKTYRKLNYKKELTKSAKWRSENPDYFKIYHQKNRNEILNHKRNYYAKNSEKLRTASLLWKKENPNYEKKYRESNKFRYNFKRSKRHAKQMQRTPKWLTEENWNEIKFIYNLCSELAWLSEEQLTVDHIIPMQGKNVSGLNVPWNLQIISRNENISKRNRFDGTYDNINWNKF